MKGKRIPNFLISMGLVAAMTLAPFSEICVTATDAQEVAENAAGETSQGVAPAVDQETPKTEETNPASEPEQAQQTDPAQQGETEAGSSQPEGEAETETKEADSVLEEGIRTEESEEQKPEEEVLTVEEGADGTFTVLLAKDSVPAGAVKVLFPTWSETKKQDDLIWYEGKKEADGSYTCKIDLGRHRHLGRFITHAYYEDKAGKKVIIAGTTFEVEAPTGKLEIVPGSLNYKAGTVRVRMTGIEGAARIKKVEFPTWSLNKKQDDIRWYEGSRAANGDYIYTINIKNHGYDTGIYAIHGYIMDVTGERHFTNGEAADFSVAAEITVDPSADKEKTFVTHADGVRVPAGAKKIEFAVWSQDRGQDDIKWYTGKETEEGSFAYPIEVKNHKGAGNYLVHVYAKLKSDRMAFLGATEFTVTPATGSLHIDSVDGKKGTFRIVGEAQALSDVASVRYAVWRDANQKDLHWYAAKKQADGTYTASMNVSNHKYHFGEYKIHMYVTGKNGVENIVAGTKQKIETENFVYAIKAKEDGSVYTIGIINPKVDGKAATKVELPTWSKTKDQDDIKWYQAKKGKDGHWTATVHSSNHKHAGVYLTHAYVNGKYVGQTTYSMKRVVLHEAINNGSTGLKLIGFNGYTPSAARVNRMNALINNVQRKGASIGFVMIDINTQRGVAYNSNLRVFSASTIKGLYVGSLVEQNPARARASTGLILDILRNSSNSSYATLRAQNGHSYLARWCRELGIRPEVAAKNYVNYSPIELAKLWTRNYALFNSGGFGSELGGWFEQVRYSAGQTVFKPKGWRVRSKGGWTYGSVPTSNDGAIIYAPNGPYIYAILTTLSAADYEMLYPILEEINNMHNEMVR